MTEQWRAIEGYEGRYEVSDLGRVSSLPRAGVKRGPRWIPGGILKMHLDRTGYFSVALRKDGKRRMIRVHRLVAAAFVPVLLPFHRQVAHLDGTRTNNAAFNLKWASNRENSAHKRWHGTHQAGEKHPRAKLTLANIATIKASTLGNSEMGRRLGVTESAIRKIRAGRRWREDRASPDLGSPTTIVRGE